MKTINIGTWNVDWFRNGRRSSDMWKYLEKDCGKNTYNNVISRVKEFLETENAIIFLQEVPCQIKNDKGWLECSYHKQLYIDFPTNEYDIIENSTNYCTRCTVAIYKKEMFKENKSYAPCNNRTVSLCVDDITLLGVHMPTEFKENDSNDNMWLELIEYASYNIKLIIAGDFNAYIGCKNELTEERYVELCRHTKDIVSDDTPTYWTYVNTLDTKS